MRKKVGQDFVDQELKSNMQTLDSFTITPGFFFLKVDRIGFHSMLSLTQNIPFILMLCMIVNSLAVVLCPERDLVLHYSI